VDSSTRDLRCHWESAGDASLCDEIIAGVEEAWSIQVDELGWPAPLPDDDGLLDVYVSSDAGGFAYTQGTESAVDPEDGTTGTSAFIVFDPSFETTISWTMLHEFNHVLQFGIDPSERSAVAWEGVATAMEWFSDRSLVAQDVYISDFQADPWLGLVGNGYGFGVDSLYEYGSALWVFHLDHHSGDGKGSAALDLWLDNAQAGWDNEPDFIDALGTVYGSDWDSAWLDFIVSRIAVGTADAPEWAKWWKEAEFGIHIEDSISASELPTSVTPANMPLQTGAVYAELTGLELGQRIRIHADGDPSVDWAVFDFQNGRGEWNTGGTLEVEAQGSSLIFGAVNLGASGFDPDDIIEGSSVSIEVRVLDTADDLEDDEKGGGCATAPASTWDTADDLEDDEKGGGCATAPASNMKLWLSVLAILGWRRRQ